MKRRTLLNSALATGSLSALAMGDAWSVDDGGEAAGFDIIDTNVSLFRWPFRRLPLDEPEKLVKKLSSLGIAQAWAGSFEGVFQRDIRAVNERLAAACRLHDQLVPIGSINPEMPGWEEDLKQCREGHRMPGIRLHPNYHGYSLGDECFEKLLKLADESNLFVQIAVALEDTRTQPLKFQVADVDLAPLPGQLKKCPGSSRVQILNGKLRGAVLETLAQTPGVFIDTARAEGTDGIATLLKTVPSERVLFGTHAPFLIPEASLIRVHESDLSEADLLSVLRNNADRFRNS